MEKASKVCYEMFEQRLYKDIAHVDDRIVAIKRDGSSVCAFLTLNIKLNTEIAQQYLTIMKDLDISHGIILYKDTVTSSAKKIIDIFNESNMDSKIELFLIEELQYNITKHRLQPEKFEKLSEEDNKAFKKVYGSNYPIMLTTDKIARFYGYQKGDILKVYHKNGYITYLFVK